MPRRDWRRFRESRWNGLPALCLKLLYNSSFFSANSGKQKRLPVSFATRLDSSVQFNRTAFDGFLNLDVVRVISGYTAISQRLPPKISLTDFGDLDDILRGFTYIGWEAAH